MKIKIFYLSTLFFLLSNLYVSGYTVISSSFIGGGADDIFIGAAIQTDGTLVVAGKTGITSFGGQTAVTLNGASQNSQATIIRLTTDGQTVLSVTKVGSDILDIYLDGLDNIYVALGEAGALKLDPAASSVLWSVDDVDIHRVDAGPSGYSAMMGKERDYNFGGYSMVRLYEPDGDMVFERNSEQRYKDIGISEDKQMIIACGFNVDFMGEGEFHLAFYEGISFNGGLRYTGYDWKKEDWIGKNPWEQVRPRTMCMGQDKNFYLGNMWTGKRPGVLQWDPFDRTKEVSVVGGDDHTNPSNLWWGEEGDSKKKLFFIRYGIQDGSYQLGQMFAPISDAGPNMIAIGNPGAMSVDREGRVYISGSSASGLPVDFDMVSGSYEGGGFLTIFASDFATREYCAVLNMSILRAIEPRSLNGNNVVLVAGRSGSDPTDSYITNAVQSSQGGGDDGYFAVINEPGTTTSPVAPSNVVVDSSSAKFIALSWDDNSDNEDGFYVERKTNSGSFEKIASVVYDINSFVDLHVESGVNYTYRVASFNLEGTSSYATSTQQTVSSPSLPAVPAGFSAKVTGVDQIQLTWDQVADANGYILEQKEQGESNFRNIADLSSGQLSFNVTELNAGTQYTYRIRAYNNDGFSDFSTEISASTQGLPLHEAIDPSDITTGICYFLYGSTWGGYPYWPEFGDETPVQQGVTDVIDVNVQRDTFDIDFALFYKGYLEVPANGTYYFRLNVDKGGMLFIDDSLIIDNSGWKWGSYQMSGQIGLEAGKHTFILQHIYSYCCGSPTLDLYIKGPGISEQILPSSMLYRDNTCDPTGDKPAAPDNLRFNVLSGNSVEIIWDDNSNNEGGFLVETDNTREWNTYDTYKEIVSVGSNITSYVNNHLIPNDTIKYRIRAFNAYGYSDYCAVDSVVTGSTTDYKPISPDLLEANYIEDHQINITWRDNSYNEEGFIVEYKKIEDTSYTVAGTSGMDMNNFSITGLESNTDYHIRVKAFNNEGESGYSQEIQVKTLVTDVYAVKVDNVNNKIVLAPNPTNGIVNVFNAPDPVDDFRVINMMGEQVMRLESASQIDLGGLPEGIYLIKIGSNIVKVVKQ